MLAKDRAFLPLICVKLLLATEAKHSEMACLWLYDFVRSERPNARLFALQFVPCLVWCVLTRPPSTVSGEVAVLLSLFKKERAILEKHKQHNGSAKQTQARDRGKSRAGRARRGGREQRPRRVA